MDHNPTDADSSAHRAYWKRLMANLELARARAKRHMGPPPQEIDESKLSPDEKRRLEEFQKQWDAVYGRTH